jgi:hypothetical protein
MQPDSEVHATRRVGGHGRSLLGLVGDDGLGREEQRGNRRGVLQSRAGHLGRVDDALCEQVTVLTGRSVEAESGLELGDLVGHNTGLHACVEGDLLQRRLDGNADDVRARCLVTGELESLERLLAGLDESDATTGDDALLDGCLRVANGVLDAVLALLELDLGGRARLDDGDAAGELGEALLELLAVVVAGGFLDMSADLLHAALDV